MAEDGFKRKLTAILSADVEGYSRLMGEDEDATIRTLTAYRELISILIQKHSGRVIDSPGDNLLAEFLSVVDAVRCAVEIQEELKIRNAELPENRRMEFRIGINLGDEDYMNHWGLGYVFLQKRLYDQAMAAYEKALALNSNDADLLAEMADALIHVGRPQDAIEQMKRAMRLNPISPNWYAWTLGWAYYHTRQYEEAIAAYKPLLHLGWPSVPRRLAASYAQLGHLEEARTQAVEVLKTDPDFSIATLTKTHSYKNSTDLEHYLDGLRKAGLK
jgi:tetratricopeptide (TPR) repeat protein